MNEARPSRTATPYQAGGRRRGAPSGRAVPSRRPVSNARGGSLNALAACLISLGVSVIAAIADAVINNGFTGLFTAVFVIDAIVIALTVRYADLMAAVIMPPISYLIALVIGVKMQKGDGTISNSTLAFAGVIGDQLGEQMVALLIGTGAAVLVAIARFVRVRRATA